MRLSCGKNDMAEFRIMLGFSLHYCIIHIIFGIQQGCTGNMNAASLSMQYTGQSLAGFPLLFGYRPIGNDYLLLLLRKRNL